MNFVVCFQQIEEDGLTLELLSNGRGYVDFDQLFVSGRMVTGNLGTVLSSHPDTMALARKAVDAAVFRVLTEGKSNLRTTNDSWLCKRSRIH